MLEFFKDGKKVKISPIYSNGQIGQMVIYGQNVDWGPRATPESDPLSRYPAPSIFIILEIGKDYRGKPSFYNLKDSTGNCFNLDTADTATWYLYDAQEWLEWQNLHQTEKIARKQNKIELLESHLSLLKDILIKQGVHIVTKEQAKELKL